LHYIFGSAQKRQRGKMLRRHNSGKRFHLPKTAFSFEKGSGSSRTQRAHSAENGKVQILTSLVRVRVPPRGGERVNAL